MAGVVGAATGMLESVRRPGPDLATLHCTPVKWLLQPCDRFLLFGHESPGQDYLLHG